MSLSAIVLVIISDFHLTPFPHVESPNIYIPKTCLKVFLVLKTWATSSKYEQGLLHELRYPHPVNLG